MGEEWRSPPTGSSRLSCTLFLRTMQLKRLFSFAGWFTDEHSKEANDRDIEIAKKERNSWRNRKTI
jgi:hypothetical protein